MKSLLANKSNQYRFGVSYQGRVIGAHKDFGLSEGMVCRRGSSDRNHTISFPIRNCFSGCGFGVLSYAILVSDLVDDSFALIKSVGTGLKFCLETDDVEVFVAQDVKAGAVSDGEVAEGKGSYLFILFCFKNLYIMYSIIGIIL